MSRTEASNRNALGSFEDLSHDMERIFDSLVGRRVGTFLRNGSEDKYVPALDVAETDEGFEVAVDLPGVKPEDVKLEMRDGKLIISGQRASLTSEDQKNYHRVERVSGSFYRAIALVNEIDVDKIDAHYEHGVLHITLPKVAKQLPRKIEIRTGGTN